MIRVTVELLSAISPDRNRKLGVMFITNDGTGNVTFGNYDCQMFNGNGTPSKKGRVEHYPRNAVSIWNLLRRACEAAGYTK